MKEAVRLARDMRPDLAIEGPIQYDAAVDPTIAQQKVHFSDGRDGRIKVLLRRPYHIMPMMAMALPVHSTCLFMETRENVAHTPSTLQHRQFICGRGLGMI